MNSIMIETNLKSILSKQFGQLTETIGDTDHLVNDLGADSLDLLEIVLAIESNFSIKIYEHEYEQAMTVDQLSTMIQNKKLS